MTQPASVWRVTTTAAADRDIEEIHDWTQRRFGLVQADAYSAAIGEAIAALSGGPATRASGIARRSGAGSTRSIFPIFDGEQGTWWYSARLIENPGR